MENNSVFDIAWISCTPFMVGSRVNTLITGTDILPQQIGTQFRSFHCHFATIDFTPSGIITAWAWLKIHTQFLSAYGL